MKMMAGDSAVIVKSLVAGLIRSNLRLIVVCLVAVAALCCSIDFDRSVTEESVERWR